MNMLALYSGCKPTAVEGCDVLKQLKDAAGDRIIIMAGAGVKSSNVADVIRRTGVTECHASARICRCVRIVAFSISIVGNRI